MLPLPDTVAGTLPALLKRALREDVSDGDVTSLATLAPETQAKGHFLSKEDGILAGLAVAERVFDRVDPTVDLRWKTKDGASIHEGTVFGTIEGTACSILTAERLALNLLQRMSGIATATHAMVEKAGTAQVLDTRKTAPGLRTLDKWAVLLGGGTNHRMGLYDQVLIKDNHIAACGGVREALEATVTYQEMHGTDLPVEIEARTLDEVDLVLRAHDDGIRVDTILLDNMVQRTDSTIDVSKLDKAVRRINGRIRTEASGNVSLDTAEAIAQTGVNAISSGALTHSVRALDLSLKLTLQS